MCLRVVLLSLCLLVARLAPAATVRVAAGDPSPLGLPFSTFTGLALGGDGRVAFVGASTGVFRRSGATLAHVVAAGDVLADGRQVAGVSNPAAGPSGCVAVRAFLVGGGSRLLRRCGTQLDALVTAGTPAPGGGVIADLLAGVAYGPGGEVAFTALLDDGGTALIRANGTTLTRIARTGDTAPSGGTFVQLRLVGVSTGGAVAFRGSVTGGRDGLFSGSGDQGSVVLRPIVIVGDAAFAGGGTFTQLQGASVNDGGVWAFRGEITGGKRAGVFRADASGPVVFGGGVVLEGDDVPGSTGVTIKQLASSIVPSINASGAITYRATLGGAETGSAIFVSVPGGKPSRVLSTRDPTAVGALVRFRDPSMADDGSVLISASITGSGPGLFVYRAGVVSSLASLGDATDVDTGQERFRFATPSVRDSAETAAFIGSREGVFVAGASGGVERLAFIGGPTPLGGTYASFDAPAVDAGGVIAFGAEIKDGRASRALVSVSGGNEASHVVAATTAKAPGGGQFVDFFASTIDSLARSDVGPRGEVAFEATLQGSKTPRGIFLKTGKKMKVLARARKKAPGGGTYDTFGTPALLGGNRIAFVAHVDDDAGQVNALFARVRGGLKRIAATGDGAPGRMSGRFDEFDPPDADATLIACRATLSEGGKEGIFLQGAKKGFGLLVGTGDPATPGATFRSFGRPLVSDAGVAFLGRLAGDPTPPTLFRATVTAVPAPSAGAPAVDVVIGPGSPTPLGGAVSEITAVDGNRAGGLAVIADLVGAGARTAILADLP